jgi:mono/diheme cytochrome c family protein
MRTFRLIAVTIAAVLCTIPVVAAAQRTASPPPASVDKLPQGNREHGRYLAEHVAMCIECHSMRDGNGVIVEGAEYLGGEIPFAPPWPNNWAMRAPRNRGLVGYDDKAALRLLTQGAIGRDGKPLRRPMPRVFMTPQDAADVIAYLRSLN